MTVAGYLKARYKSDALVVITSLGLIVMCIGTFLFLFFVLRAGGGLAAVMSTADSLLILTVAAIVKDLWETYMVKDDPVKNEIYEKHVKLVSTSFS